MIVTKKPQNGCAPPGKHRFKASGFNHSPVAHDGRATPSYMNVIGFGPGM